jgi:hypothetical protein
MTILSGSKNKHLGYPSVAVFAWVQAGGKIERSRIGRPAIFVRLVAAGGGIDMDMTVRPVEDLIRIAPAAARTGARVIFRGTRGRPVNDLIAIATAGKNWVTFAG